MYGRVIGVSDAGGNTNVSFLADDGLTYTIHLALDHQIREHLGVPTFGALRRSYKMIPPEWLGKGVKVVYRGPYNSAIEPAEVEFDEDLEVAWVHEKTTTMDSLRKHRKYHK